MAAGKGGRRPEGEPSSTENEAEPGPDAGNLETREVKHRVSGLVLQEILVRVPDPRAGSEGRHQQVREEKQLHWSRSGTGREELSDDAQEQGAEADRQVHYSSPNADSKVVLYSELYIHFVTASGKINL